MFRSVFLLFGIFSVAATAVAQQVRPLDWSKLDGSANDDELATLCATVLAHTQKDFGKDWLDKVNAPPLVDSLIDFARIDGSLKKNRRRAIEDCIRPVTTSCRTIALAIRSGIYDEAEAGATITEIESLLPLVLRSVAKDHLIHGGIGQDTWGDSWQSAMWAGQLAHAAWIFWDQLNTEDQKLVTDVLIHEANRFLDVPPPTSDRNSRGDTKGEENAWNAGCLFAAATMLNGHPNEAAWREQAIVYSLNAVATPHDLNSDVVVDGKAVSDRLHGYCITEDYAVGNHGAYPPPGYTAASYLDPRVILFCTLAGVDPPEAILYNAAPIYRMFVDHHWAAPPYRKPGGTVYRRGGDIYWPIEKEKERAGRYYIWLKQDILAATFGFDTDCSTKADHWAKLHGQYIVDAVTGKDTPIPLEAYHQGAFFKNALTAYLLRVLHSQGHLAAIPSLSAKSL